MRGARTVTELITDADRVAIAARANRVADAAISIGAIELAAVVMGDHAVPGSLAERERARHLALMMAEFEIPDDVISPKPSMNP